MPSAHLFESDQLILLYVHVHVATNSIFKSSWCDIMEDEASRSDTETTKSRYVKRSRRNTLIEKHMMRNVRKKRKRLQRIESFDRKFQEFEKSYSQERSLREQAEQKVFRYKNMSRCYWERWNWELQKRKEAAALRSRNDASTSASTSAVGLHQIEPSMLKELENSSESERWAGRGSFGVVKINFYRSIKVVTKELLPKTLVKDVEHEASILTKLCHPYLPFLFGLCTKDEPYKLVMQFHGLRCEPYTLSKSLSRKEGLKLSTKVWLSLCAQMVEAIRYLHQDVEVLHNDIKCNNILLSQSVSTLKEYDPEISDYEHIRVQIVVIDFGMASLISENKRLRLTENEKADYHLRYAHIAPEVIEGDHKLSPQSDIFSLGSVLYTCKDKGCFNDLVNVKTGVTYLADRCHSLNISERPKASTILEELLGT